MKLAKIEALYSETDTRYSLKFFSTSGTEMQCPYALLSHISRAIFERRWHEFSLGGKLEITTFDENRERAIPQNTSLERELKHALDEYKFEQARDRSTILYGGCTGQIVGEFERVMRAQSPIIVVR